MRSSRPRFSYANVVATLALFVALGGTAVAAALITGDDVKNSSLTGVDVRKDSIKSADVAGLRRKDFLASERAKLRGPRGRRGATGPQGPGVTRIAYSAQGGSGPQVIFSGAGFTLAAACTGGGDDFVTLIATTDTNGSIVGIGPMRDLSSPAGISSPSVQESWDPGEPITLPIDDTATTLSYGRGPDASDILTFTGLADHRNSTDLCRVVGTVLEG